MAGRLALRATDDDVARLRAIIDAQQELGVSGQQSAFLALDERFHLLRSELAE